MSRNGKLCLSSTDKVPVGSDNAFPGIDPEPIQIQLPKSQFLGASPVVEPRHSAAPILPTQAIVQDVPAEAKNSTRDLEKEREVEVLKKKCAKNAKALVHIYEAAGIAPHGLSTESSLAINEWLDDNYDSLPAVLHQLYQSRAAQCVGTEGQASESWKRGTGRSQQSD